MKKFKLIVSMFVVLCFTVSVFAMASNVEEKFERGKKCPFENCNMQQDDIMFVLTMFECPQTGDGFGYKHHFKNNMQHKNFNGYKNFKSFEKKLNLSDEQKNKLKQIKEKEFIVKKQFADIMKAINEEFTKENPNEKSIKNMQKEAKKLSQEIIDNYVVNKKQFKEILSSEQYNKMFVKKTGYDMMAERLNLTDEQKEKTKTLFEQNKEKIGNMKKTLFENKIKLEKELEKETVDTNIVDSLSQEISQISQDIVKNNINMKVELKNILTAEQYDKFTGKTKHFKHHHKK